MRHLVCMSLQGEFETTPTNWSKMHKLQNILINLSNLLHCCIVNPVECRYEQAINLKIYIRTGTIWDGLTSFKWSDGS